MIEAALGVRRVKAMKPNRQRSAGSIDRCHLSSAKIIGLDFPMEVKRFHQERWKLRDTRSHIEAPAMRVEALAERTGDSASQPFTGLLLGLPELIAAFVAIDRTECLIVQLGKEFGDGGSC